MDILKNKLLNSNPEEILAQLQNIPPSDVSEIESILILLWQVHPDEEIQQTAYGLLAERLGPQQEAMLQETFAIFQSVTDFLPWMGDYQSLQQQNYEKFQAGRAPYASLLATSSVFVHYYLDIGRKLVMLFDLKDEAQDCFENIIQHHPTNDEAYYALARLAEKACEIEVAQEYYEQCLQHNEGHLYANLQLGMLKAQQLDDPQGAMHCYNKVAELDPYMTEIYVRMAEACHLMEDKKRRKHFIEIALGINEYHEDALNLLGIIQWKEENDIDGAIETFQKGLDHKIHGDSGVLLASLGELYASQFSEYEKAKVFYEKSLKAKPNQPATLLKYMTILENIFQDYGAMSMAYETFLQHSQEHVGIYVAYANFLIKYMHDYEFAKMQLDQALAINDSDVDASKLLRQISGYLATNEEETEEELDDYDDDDDDDDFVGGGAAGDS